MRHAERIVRLVSGCAAVAISCMVAPVAARAAGPSSTLTITAPSSSPYLIDNQVTGNEQLSVGGTTQGLANTNVDIKCYSGNGFQTLKPGVHVASDGTYQASSLSFRGISRQTCVLRAVPVGDANDYAPGSASPFSGPVVNLGQATQTTVASGPNAGKLEYYYLYNSQPAGAFEYASLGGCSISQSHSYDPVTFGSGDPQNPQNQNVSQTLDFCNAWFSWGNGDTSPSAPHTGEAPPTRSELRVDGLDAYVAGNAFGINGMNTFNNPGYPALNYSYSVDPDTGNLSLDETDQVVRCSPGGVFPPDPAHCASFAPTGIQVTMHIVQNEAGQVAEIVQRFQSTDNAPHTVDALENNDFYHRGKDGELNFPWTGSGMQPYTTPGQVVAGPSAAGPGSFFVKGSASVPDGSPAAPQGQVTFSNPPSSETIVGTTNDSQHFSWVDLHYALTIPAGGSVPLGFSYSNGFTAAQAAADAAAAQSLFRPTVSIASPQSGIDTAQPTVNVSGHAGDATGLGAVTVNGRSVAVAGDGAWSTVVGLTPGLNAITAVAGNVFGNRAQAQTTVVYVPPPALAGIHQAHRRWREGGRRGRPGHPKPPIGTAFSWQLNEPAQLRFVFTQQVPGRRVHGACKAPSRRNRHRRTCLRTVTVGAHTMSAGAGSGRWTFKGAMPGGRKLKPGTYTVTVVARSPTTGAQSSPVRLRFTIVS